MFNAIVAKGVATHIRHQIFSSFFLPELFDMFDKYIYYVLHCYVNILFNGIA